MRETQRITNSCTTMAAGKNSNVYGCSIVAHSSDADLGDPSVAYVPPMDWAGNCKRPIYAEAVALGDFPIWNMYSTPHLNLRKEERGPDYDYALPPIGPHEERFERDFDRYCPPDDFFRGREHDGGPYRPKPCGPSKPLDCGCDDDPNFYQPEGACPAREEAVGEWNHRPPCPPRPIPPFGQHTPVYPRSIKIGSIQQVSHTYGYLDSCYGMMNEKGLCFGECTNGTDFQCGPTDSDDGVGDVKRLFYSSELSRIALERCTTCREAIDLIGGLIDQFGFWGTGETLPMADGEEQWIMEMAPGRDGTGGYWAAQRVPDDQIAWCSNNNIIRKVLKESRGHAFQDLSSGINTYEHITCNKLWADFDPMTQEPWLDFAKCVTSRNEYNHPYYSLRRRWRALSLCAPSLNLSPECEDGFHEYPFAVTPDKLLTLKDIFKIYRDRYEGTEFDLTKKGVIDPFNNPNRYNTAGKDASGDVGTSTPEGAWERSICWYYTDISWVCVPDKRDKKTGLDAMCWVSLNVPGEAPFVPLAIGPIPDSYKKISTKIFDEKKAFWTYNRVAEECYRKYCFIKPEVQKMIDFTEGKSFHFLTQLQDDPRVCNVIGTVNHEAEEIRKEWDKFWRKLVAKYNQGFRLSKFDPNKPWTGEWVQQGYPSDWLETSEWKDGPTTYDGQTPVQMSYHRD